ncbi:MAG: tetratricopeptide repeat protein, partial [marine benthic group bacterium]|nr:tetratricopeptide repeat protein [Gemmatimonadota bacterium]
YEGLDRVDAARAQYLAALRIDPADSRAMGRLSNSYLKQGDPSGARDALEPWIDHPDPAVAAHARLLTGDAWAWEGEFERAVEYYRQVETIGNAQDSPDLRADGLEGALAVQWAADSAWGGTRLGRYRSIWKLLELGRLDEARNVVEAAERVQVTEADRILPVDYHVILYAKGRVYEARGHRDAAIDAYRQLLADWGDEIESLPRFRDAPQRLQALEG